MVSRKEIALVLHNIRSAHNVGSLFRTADAAGVSKIVISGYTPAPLDEFKRTQKDIAKTALGAEQTVAWELSRGNITKLLKVLKKEDWWVVGVEQDSRAVDFKKYKPTKEKYAIILGNEVRGLSKQVRDSCDDLVEIPMRGKKESLNVSVAGGVVLYGIFGGN
ncbi:MAG: TrmH family RNA methyltransferase [Patescibacteria group bacterium]